ncbi:MAG: hypothetical protein K2X87_08555 [Gemmataceae bacterium]|nr:hypothetical protein [Gemmataceae bacterium]
MNELTLGTSRLKQQPGKVSYLILIGPADKLEKDTKVKVERLKAKGVAEKGVVWDGKVLDTAEREGKRVVAVVRLTYSKTGPEIPPAKKADEGQKADDTVKPMLPDRSKDRAHAAPVLCSVSVGDVNPTTVETEVELYGDGD